jgi:hypothetical protein
MMPSVNMAPSHDYWFIVGCVYCKFSASYTQRQEIQINFKCKVLEGNSRRSENRADIIMKIELSVTEKSNEGIAASEAAFILQNSVQMLSN